MLLITKNINLLFVTKVNSNSYKYKLFSAYVVKFFKNY